MIKQKLQAIHGFLMAFIKVFNFGFFVVTGVLLTVMSLQKMIGQGFDFSLFWNVFNELYGHFSFKVGCLFLIIFNGLAALQGFFQQYLDMTERLEHGRGIVQKIRKWRAK